MCVTYVFISSKCIYVGMGDRPKVVSLPVWINNNYNKAHRFWNCFKL
jgi:hypothetical protein